MENIISIFLSELIWTGAVCGLIVIVIICIVLLLVVRRRFHKYRARSGTDTSMLSHLTAAAARSEEEQGNVSHLHLITPPSYLPLSKSQNPNF